MHNILNMVIPVIICYASLCFDFTVFAELLTTSHLSYSYKYGGPTDRRADRRVQGSLLAV